MKNINNLYVELWNLKTQYNDIYRKIEDIKKEIELLEEKNFSKYTIDELINKDNQLVINVNDGSYFVWIQDGCGDFIKSINNDAWNETTLRLFLKCLSQNN